MSQPALLASKTFEVPCTIEVSNTFDSLHAHVNIDADIAVEPGDTVHVHGSEIIVPYGETAVFKRTATLTRASGAERLWVRMTGDFEFMELFEFSFSSGERL